MPRALSIRFTRILLTFSSRRLRDRRFRFSRLAIGYPSNDYSFSDILIAPRTYSCSAIAKVAAALAAAASGEPTASVVVQQLTAASPANGITHNKGKLAGLALIIVNSFVGLAALMLNRRRRNT